jgi:hypothetical protein
MYRLHLRPARSARGLPVLGLTALLTAAGLACTAAVPALAVPAGRATPPGSGMRGAASPGGVTGRGLPGPVRRLLLINGDRLAVTTTGGRQIVAVRPAGRRDAVTSLGSGGQLAEIPAAAVPYLGHGLSPGLFKLSALEKAEPGGRLPVRVTFTGRRRPAIPGVRFTRSSAGRASGYLTAASARAFGAALWRQFTADHARGSYGSDGLFGHGVSISLADAPAALLAGARARPDFPMHTLTVRATDMHGQPDTGDTIVISNVDNIERFDGYNETSSYFWHGSAKFSLPAGHYWAFASFISFSGSNPTALRMVVLPQFTVTGPDTTVRVSARSASSKVTMATPRRSVAAEETFAAVRWARAGDRGLPDYEGWTWSGITGWVSPTSRKPTVGTMRAFTSGTLLSPAGVRPGYAYNLDFPSAGLIPTQHFTVTPSSLGTVTERYYQDLPASNAGWAAFGGAPVQIGPAPVWQFRLPQVQTQYFSAARDLLWSLATYTSAGQLSGGDTDLFRSFSGGEHQTQDWNQYPLHPAPDTTLGGVSAAFPVQTSAGRAGNTLRLDFTPFSDNQFGHTGPGYIGNGSARVTGTYAVAQNGRMIADGSAVNGIPAIRLAPRPSTVRFTLTASRHSRFLPLSPASRTVWTWRSARDTTAQVPRAWYCSYTQLRYSVRYHRRCAVQHLMTLSYQVQGMSLTGLTRPGAQVVDVTAGHIQLGGSAQVTGATAQVSFNGGRTWSPARVTARGGGHFKVAYDAPAGARVTLRVSATDTAGSSISETITSGYGVSR